MALERQGARVNKFIFRVNEKRKQIWPVKKHRIADPATIVQCKSNSRGATSQRCPTTADDPESLPFLKRVSANISDPPTHDGATTRYYAAECCANGNHYANFVRDHDDGVRRTYKSCTARPFTTGVENPYPYPAALVPGWNG